jgi:hypothetical protein
VDQIRIAFQLDLPTLDIPLHLCASAPLRFFRKSAEHGTMGAMDSETGETPRDRHLDTKTLIVIGLLAVALVWRLVYFLEMYASPYGARKH